MNLVERIDRIITGEEHKAYVLLADLEPGGWREKPEQYLESLSRFREAFDERVRRIESAFGSPSYIEHEYSSRSPDWAPIGLYADWSIAGTDSVICIFLAGDGNPEDPMVLLGGRAKGEARFSQDDPWGWDWVE